MIHTRPDKNDSHQAKKNVLHKESLSLSLSLSLSDIYKMICMYFVKIRNV